MLVIARLLWPSWTNPLEIMTAYRRCGILQGALSVAELSSQAFFVSTEESDIVPLAPIPDFLDVQEMSWNEDDHSVNQRNLLKVTEQLDVMQTYVAMSALAKGALPSKAEQGETAPATMRSTRKRPLKLSSVYGTLNVQQLHLQQTKVLEDEEHKKKVKQLAIESKEAEKQRKESELNRLEHDFLRCSKVCECGEGEMCIAKRLKRCSICKEIKRVVCRKKQCQAQLLVKPQVSPQEMVNKEKSIMTPSPQEEVDRPVNAHSSKASMQSLTFLQLGHTGHGFDNYSAEVLIESLSKTLTPEQRNLVKFTLTGIKNRSKKLNLQLWRWNMMRGRMRYAYIDDTSLLRLDPHITDSTSKWLNDDVIDFVGELLNERERAKRAHVVNYPSKVFVTSQLAKSLYVSFYEDNIEFSAIHKYVRDWPLLDVSEQALILCPVNISNNHWILMCIAPQTKVLMTVDSFGQNYAIFKDPFLKWIELNYLTFGKTFNYDDWQYLAESSPRQTNGYDCGVFVITSSLFILDDIPLSFSQEKMNSWREKWIYNILHLTIKSSFKYDHNLTIDLSQASDVDDDNNNHEDHIDSAIDIPGGA